jgi:hypothetical protein
MIVYNEEKSNQGGERKCVLIIHVFRLFWNKSMRSVQRRMETSLIAVVVSKSAKGQGRLVGFVKTVVTHGTGTMAAVISTMAVSMALFYSAAEFTTRAQDAPSYSILSQQQQHLVFFLFTGLNRLDNRVDDRFLDDRFVDDRVRDNRIDDPVDDRLVDDRFVDDRVRDNRIDNRIDDRVDDRIDDDPVVDDQFRNNNIHDRFRSNNFNDRFRNTNFNDRFRNTNFNDRFRNNRDDDDPFV